MTRPVIGVTGPDKGGLSAWIFTARAVRRAGAKPVRIRPNRPRGLDEIDGLIIGGGADVSPALYGQRRLPHLDELKDRGSRGLRRVLGIILYPLVFIVRRLLTTRTSGLSTERDELEKALINEAIERRLPMMGICRGMQLINVACGGTLHQDIEGFYEEYPAVRSVLARKKIRVAAHSHLAAVLDRTELFVNALHSQAIDRLGEGLRVCATEPNGVIQAIERSAGPMLLGLQWHPEYLPHHARQRALFEALVRAASKNPST